MQKDDRKLLHLLTWVLGGTMCFRNEVIKLDKTFCPFVNGECRKDCVFRKSSLAQSINGGFSSCGIAVGLANINDRQSDELQEILRAVETIKK